MNIQYRLGGFNLNLELNIDELTASLVGFEGADSSLNIPSSLSIGDAEYNLISVEKKAFLGCKGLRHVTLPSSVRSLGDWAFSQCIHMDSFSASREIALGRGVFEGCARLSYVDFESAVLDAPYLLGCVINKLPAPYLLSPAGAGKQSWFENFDSALSQYLKESDYSDSLNNTLCGEEDISYDDIGSVDGELLGENFKYIQEITKKKCYLCLVRLQHSSFISDTRRLDFESYVKSHSIGTKNDAAWQTIRDDFSDDKELFSLFLSIIEPDSDAIDMMLNDLGGSHPQAKATLLNYKKTSPKVDSFFEDLLL